MYKINGIKAVTYNHVSDYLEGINTAGDRRFLFDATSPQNFASLVSAQNPHQIIIDLNFYS